MVLFFEPGDPNFQLPRDMIKTNQYAPPQRQQEQHKLYWSIEPTTYYLNETMMNLQTMQPRIFLRIVCVWKPVDKENQFFSIPGSKLFERDPPINPDQNILCVNELWFKNPNMEFLRPNNFGYLYDWLDLIGHNGITGELIWGKAPFTIQWIDFAYRVSCDFLKEPIIGLRLWECISLLQKFQKNHNDNYQWAYNAK